MKRVTKQNWGIGRAHLGLSAIPLALWLVASGCSMADAPPSTPGPETDVTKYYLPLSTPKMHYEYSVVSTAQYHPASGTLAMDMQGVSDALNGIPVYSCLWSYKNYGTPTQWYYALNATEAIDLGIEPTPGGYTDHWVDLQSPLQDGAKWSFTSQGDVITATIVKYGVSAQVEGKTYGDVVIVQYAGAGGTTGSEWFARGVGLIYYHIERPGFGMIENHLQSVQQR